NIVTTNMIHPVMTSDALGGMLLLISVWGPWMALHKWVGKDFHSIVRQWGAGLSMAAVYTAVVLNHPGFVPPPFFNWQPVLFIVVSWTVGFSFLRALDGVWMVMDRKNATQHSGTRSFDSLI
ncbi:MAG: hypothetical protein OWS74_02225, partial [Firmicutes bacterium]|nr:hypothetical protein [Bacillota bacterium]